MKEHAPIMPSLYVGEVVHRRLRPVAHELHYSVASLLVDVDDLASGRLPRLLSYNRFNLFSLRDSDHGPKEARQTIASFAWGEIAKAGLAGTVQRILMLSYPRIFGYAFNPLTVFYGLDGEGVVRIMVFEVHNTFGGRHCYVAGPFEAETPLFSDVEKTFRVSPFNGMEGHYGLRATVPGERLSVGVTLTTTDGPLMKAWFSGSRAPLSNAGLLRVLFRFPLMTFKVMAAIHWEALKLWKKGLKLKSP